MARRIANEPGRDVEITWKHDDYPGALAAVVRGVKVPHKGIDAAIKRAYEAGERYNILGSNGWGIPEEKD